ncbi:hypothetical protein AWW67_09060 [Roseivirga seohaensis]|uniref:Uncharacterized protein n=1 Tax=Roseivirga seohaensis TaxID=1914963 RepID=A0A150XNQ1_9BACT|nr:hypothetical protein [Roseivirga seohaensis]KYG80321.1 hypothetical protein AWW67_09060 [Roseivirga seohaensis]
MAQRLKLQVYKFTLRKAKSRGNTKNLEVLNPLFFGESFDIDKVQESLLKYLLLHLDQFKKDEEGNKAVKVASVYSYNEAEQRIDLMLNGGLIGVEREIFNEDGVLIGKVEKEHITSTPFYVMMYTPVDMKYGFLLVQSYSDLTITSAFYDLLQLFFRDRGISFSPFPHVPKKLREEYLKGSVTKKITFLNSKPTTSAKAKFNEVIPVEANYRLRLVLEGLDEEAKKSIGRVQKSDLKRVISTLLNKDATKAESEDYEVQMTFQSADGRITTAKMSKDFQVIPTLYLPSELLDNHSQPDFKKMKGYCLGLVNEMLSEDNSGF